MALIIAEYVVRVAVDIDDPDDRTEFLIKAAQQPVTFLIGNLGVPANTTVKLIRSGSKGDYAYTDPILSRASRRRAWKAIRKNRSDATPDNTRLETVITQGVAAAVGDEEAVAEADKRAEQEAAADAAESREGNGEAASPSVAEAGQAAEAVAATAVTAQEVVDAAADPASPLHSFVHEKPAEDNRPQ